MADMGGMGDGDRARLERALKLLRWLQQHDRDAFLDVVAKIRAAHRVVKKSHD